MDFRLRFFSSKDAFLSPDSLHNTFSNMASNSPPNLHRGVSFLPFHDNYFPKTVGNPFLLALVALGKIGRFESNYLLNFQTSQKKGKEQI
jgi:hypothetical protein